MTSGTNGTRPGDQTMTDDLLFEDDDDFLVDDGSDATADAQSDGAVAAPSGQGVIEPASGDEWVVLVVDDEPEVHAVTSMVLSDIRFKGRGITMISAYSASEAREIVEMRPDIAVVLLDVVMETDDAGLQLVRHIREAARNQAVRIILRTGPAGTGPGA